MAYIVGKYETKEGLFTYWHAGDRCFKTSSNPAHFLEFDSWEVMAKDMQKHNVIHPWSDSNVDNFINYLPLIICIVIAFIINIWLKRH